MKNPGWKKLTSAAGRLLLANLLVFAESAWAQDPKAKDDPRQEVASQQSLGKQPPAATGAKAQPEEAQGETSESVAKEKSSGSGLLQGIKVHGHWTIEVRNTHGSLVRRVEFENSIDPGFTLPSLGTNPPTPMPGGAAYLSAVLSGQWSAAAPSTWTVFLLGGSGLNSLTTATNAPCYLQGLYGFQVGACMIQAPVGACSAGISCNLSVMALGTAPAFTGIQLSGSVSAAQNGQISAVATMIQNLSCATATPNCVLPTIFGKSASFTSSTNFPGAPIAVSAGQTIAVTVTISFS